MEALFIPHTGYAEIRVGRNGKISKILRGQCTPHSAQAAEIIAIAVALENTLWDETCVIYGDSDWVMRAHIDWLPV